MGRGAVVTWFALLGVTASAGCFGLFDAPCHEFPATALVSFEYDGTNASLLDAFRDLGWSVTPGANSLSFRMAWDGNGTPATAYGHVSGLDPAGPVTLTIETGASGLHSVEAARAELRSLVDPIVDRFGGEPQYRAGNVHCGAV